MSKVFTGVMVFLFSFNLIAADSSSGCGPGWYIAKDNSLISSALRATTNGILAPTVTIGMTFGTSNCSKHSIVKLEKERVKFAEENYFELAVDSSKGSGEFLAAYGELMGCEVNSIDRFSQKMQGNFKNIFGQDKLKAEELVKKTYQVIINDKKLTEACFQA